MPLTVRRPTEPGPHSSLSSALTPPPNPKPLITASEMFPALEKLVLSAQSEVLLAFRIFDASTKLRSPEAKDLDLTSWADLFAHTAKRGVTLRLLLADFDPVFAADLHRAAWISAGRFAARINDAPNVEIICALHDCTPAPLWSQVFAPQIRKRRALLRAKPHEHLTQAQLRALKGPYQLRPITLHQKFALIDQTTAIIGGIDVDERRWDDHDHDQRPEDTWHDVSMLVSGGITADLRRHFSQCWDRARDGCGTVFSASVSPVKNPLDQSDSNTLKTSESQDKPTTHSRMSLLRTVSTHAKGPFRFGPVTQIREHETAHLDAFAKAKRSIYIETQFLRHMPLAHALAERAKEVPDLNLILVLPTEPERVIFGGSTGMDARHAQALQMRCLALLRRAFEDRLAVVSPAQPRPAPNGTPMPVAGSGIIYLHSKVTLVDDQVGIVGSANLNGRSLTWDTEASVRFHDPKVIQDLRKRLANKWLGDIQQQTDPRGFEQAVFWNNAAKDAERTPPQDRETMILPYPETRNRRFARYIPILPAAMF